MIKDKRKMVFITLHILIVGFFLSYWLLNDVWGNFDPKFQNIALLAILLALNIILVVLYLKRKVKRIFKNLFIMVTILSLLSIPFRTVWNEVFFIIPLNKEIERIQFYAERYIERTEDFELKGTVTGKRIGMTLINGPKLDEEGKIISDIYFSHSYRFNYVSFAIRWLVKIINFS